MPEITRKLYDLTRAGQIEAARVLQFRLVSLFDAMIYTADFPEGFRAALRLRGFETGVGRQPLSSGQRIELDQVSRNLQCLLADEGFTEEPVGGCPAGQGQVDPHKVEQIVQGVMTELKRRGLA